jgi:Icc-related predicted phosphoesterase
VIRIGAVGDIHIAADSVGTLRPFLADVADHADVLLLAGDLTKCGTPEEATLVADELADVTVPMLAVLGNHDHHDSRPEAVVDVLAGRGVRVLEGSSTVLDLPGGRLGVAGAKGFGGGFAGATATAFGEPEMKAFVHHTERVSARLADALDRLELDGCAAKVVLLHYSPVPETLVGERLEIYPFLGSQLLAEAVDGSGADLVLHGHAHSGSECGETPGGVPVRNVALPVIRHAYRVFTLEGHGRGRGVAGAASPGAGDREMAEVSRRR